MSTHNQGQLNQFFIQITNRFQRWEEQAMQQIGTRDLSAKEIHVLEVVAAKAEQGRSTMTEVAEELSIRISSLTTAASTLVRKGYLRREQTEDDRRIIRLRLTDKGEAANRFHNNFHEQLVSRVSELFDEKQLDTFLTSLSHMDEFFRGRPEMPFIVPTTQTQSQKGTNTMPIQFLTDSTADISPAEGAQRNIPVVPLMVNFAERGYRDNVDIDHDTFYAKLVSSEALPTTSQPTPEEFLPHFEAAKANGTELICIMLSGNLSGTYQSATIAKEICDYDGIYIVDSKSAVTGIRLLVDLGCQLREAGKTAPEIVAELEQARDKVRLMAMADTLTYLHKGGRVSSAVSIAGALMKVKPLISLIDGKLELTGKGMGIKDSVAKMAKSLEGKQMDSRLPIYIGYTHNEANSQKLLAQLEENYPDKDIENHSVGAVIGTHIGPGAIVVTYLEA